MTLALIAGLVVAVTTVAHLATLALAGHALRAGRRTPRRPAEGTPVSVIVPVCGLEPFLDEALAAAFALGGRGHELLFCAETGGDSAIPPVRRHMVANPDVAARLLVGDDPVSPNPKLNNLVKGWDAARHDWVLIADSNVILPRDAPEALFARWEPGTGMVSAPGIGTAPRGLWAELECAFLNTHQARWLIAADALGLGFAQGKIMLLRRGDLDAAGGARALAGEIAEDAAATKILGRAGLRVRLADRSFAHPLGHRRFAEIWGRQARWAKYRRACFPAVYASEILAGGLAPIALVGGLTAAHGLSMAWIAGFAAAWYGAEAAFAAAAGWRIPPRAPACWVLRDLLLPALWVTGWLRQRVVWRGHGMAVDAGPAAPGPRLKAE